MRYNTLSDKIGETNYDNCRIFIGHKFLLIEDVKKAVKQIEKKNIWQPECKHICISRKDLNEIFGDKLI